MKDRALSIYYFSIMLFGMLAILIWGMFDSYAKSLVEIACVQKTGNRCLTPGEAKP